MTTTDRADEAGLISAVKFARLTLESADEDGKVSPPSVNDWFAAQSLLLGMCMSGLIERRCGRHEAGPWFITEAGRKELSRG